MDNKKINDEEVDDKEVDNISSDDKVLNKDEDGGY